MKTSVKISLGLPVALLMVAGTAFAAGKDGSAQARFDRIDADGDGKITIDEMLARVDKRFDAADADGDGEITLEEMVARIERRRLERRAKRILARMDVDGDGKVTKTELQNRARKRFALADGNDDGQIEKSEMRRQFRRGGGKRYHHREHRRSRGDWRGEL